MGNTIRDQIAQNLENLPSLGIKFDKDKARAFLQLLDIVNKASGSLNTLEHHFKSLKPEDPEGFLLLLMAVTQNTMMRHNLGALNCDVPLSDAEVERWHTKDTSSLTKVGDILKERLRILGYSDEVLPKARQAEIAILNGAAHTRIQSRLNFLVRMIKDGHLPDVKHVLIFSGARPLYSREPMQGEFTMELFEFAKTLFTEIGPQKLANLYGSGENEAKELKCLFDTLHWSESCKEQFFHSRQQLHDDLDNHILKDNEKKLHMQFDKFFQILGSVLEKMDRINASECSTTEYKALRHITSHVHEASMALRAVTDRFEQDPALKHIDIQLITAPMKQNAAGNFMVRPTSDDTYRHGKKALDVIQAAWSAKTSGNQMPAVISISNNPYIGYQGAAAERLLGVEVETIGHAAGKDTIVTLLDAVSRWVFASTVNYLCLNKGLERGDAMKLIGESKARYPKIEGPVNVISSADVGKGDDEPDPVSKPGAAQAQP